MKPTKELALYALAWWLGGIAVIVLALLALAPSTALHRQVAGMGLVWPTWVAGGLIMVLFAVFTLAMIAAAAQRRPSLATGLAAGVGVVLAYVSSKLIKLVINQDRPCHVVVPRPQCPEAGDWSFPSNHATIAFGIATAIVVLVAAWWRWSAYVVALVAAAARVVEGVHYPHDVLAGAALGIGTTMACCYLLTPLARALLAWLTQWPLAARLLGDWNAGELESTH